MSDWSGWAAMTGVDKKLWESEWVAFIVATSPRGNALRRVATLSLALWSQQSLSTIPISSLVPLFLTRWVWANERVQWDATWAGGQRRVLPWGRLRFNGRDYSILPSACLLHLVLFAWFKWTGKKKGERIERQPRKGQLRHLHLCHCHVSATPFAALRCQYVPLLWCK